MLNDPPRVEKEPGLVNHPDFTDLNTCLKADIISVHTPLTFDGKHPTHQLISAEKLKLIQPNQILINAARGGIINEQAWVETKTQCNIIDCWENEPNIDESLYNKALIATPHIAGHSLDAKVAGSSMVYSALCDFWNTSENHTWQQALPETPNPIFLKNTKTIQSALNELFTKTHNINQDDEAIRSKSIAEVHNKYENYRRNFPIYREWHQLSVMHTENKNLDKILISLGFKLI